MAKSRHSRSRSRRHRQRGGDFLGLSFDKNRFNNSGLGRAISKTGESFGRVRSGIQGKLDERKRLSQVKAAAVARMKQQQRIAEAKRTLGMAGGRSRRRTKRSSTKRRSRRSRSRSHRKSHKSHRRSRRSHRRRSSRRRSKRSKRRSSRRRSRH